MRMKVTDVSVVAVLLAAGAAALAQPATPKTTDKPAEKAPAKADQPAKSDAPAKGDQPGRGERPKADGPVGPGNAKPPAPLSGAFPKTIPVPADVQKMGTVYYVHQSQKAQVTMDIGTTLDTFGGASNAVAGYAVAGPADNPAALKAGEWHLPVKSINTGNEKRNGHMASGMWLDADKNPDVVFKLKEVKNIEPVKAPTENPAMEIKIFNGTLVGDMTIHGVTKPVTIEKSKIRFMTGNTATAFIAPGDLLMISADMKVRLEDYGIKNPAITQQQHVMEEISVKTELIMSTEPPSDKPAEPAKKPAAEEPKKKTVGS